MNKIHLCALAALLIAFAGCSKESNKKEKHDALTFSQNQEFNFTYEADAADENIFFTADEIWLAEKTDEEGVDNSWFTIEPTSGKAGAAFISLTVSENAESDKDRSGAFTIMCGTYEKTFTILQYARNSAGSKNVYFADEKLKAYCVGNFDTDGDGKISKEEAAQITELECPEMEITSLEGIQYMTGLTSLNCRYNSIAGELNLSGMKNLKTVLADHNLLTKIDLSGCSSLETLWSFDNYAYDDDSKMYFSLTEVNLEGCSALKYVKLADNGITSLDFSDCTELEELDVTLNKLASINLSNCGKLRQASIRGNKFNSSVDFSHCSELTYLNAAEAELTGLNVSGCSKLIQFIAYRNTGIKSMDVSACTELTELNLYETGITAINVKNNTKLTKLNLGYTGGLTSIDVSACTKLTELNLQENLLETLDVSKCPELSILKAEDNVLSSINLEGCTAMRQLYLYNNRLTSIDLSSCTNLGSLAIYKNSLTSLDVNPCAGAMYFLDCKENELTQLNCDKLKLLNSIDASTNAITSLDLRECKELTEAYLNNNKLASLKIKGLDKLATCEFQSNNLERIDLRGCTAISELHIQKNADLAYVSFHGCTALNYVDCRETSVSTLDFSNNASMNFLFATDCPKLHHIYIRTGSNYSSLEYDDTKVEVLQKDPSDYNDVDGDNWGDDDVDPWNN